MSQHQQLRSHLSSLNAYERHKFLLHDYATYYGRGGASEDLQEARPLPQTDEQLLREAYQFIPDESQASVTEYRQQLARRYHARLFREYAIADLSRYKEGKTHLRVDGPKLLSWSMGSAGMAVKSWHQGSVLVQLGLRWRTRQEVVDGKGQFVCGTKRCTATDGLASFEVPFSYVESAQAKQALVKVRVCPKHAYKLNYRKIRDLEKQARREARKAAKAKRRSDRKRKRRKKRDSTERGEDSINSGGGRSSNTSSSKATLSDGQQQRGNQDSFKRRRSSEGGTAEVPATDKGRPSVMATPARQSMLQQQVAGVQSDRAKQGENSAAHMARGREDKQAPTDSSNEQQGAGTHAAVTNAADDFLLKLLQDLLQ